jgi:hypothetical protein
VRLDLEGGEARGGLGVLDALSYWGGPAIDVYQRMVLALKL